MHIKSIKTGSLDFLSEYSINISNKILGTIVNNNTTDIFDKDNVCSMLLMLITYLPTKIIS